MKHFRSQRPNPQQSHPVVWLVTLWIPDDDNEAIPTNNFWYLLNVRLYAKLFGCGGVWFILPAPKELTVYDRNMRSRLGQRKVHLLGFLGGFMEEVTTNRALEYEQEFGMWG